MPSTTQYTDTQSQTARPAKRYSSGEFLLSAFGCFAIGFWVFCDLTAFESGAEEDVRVWAPVAALYEYFGFWPAVLLLPSMGVFALWKAIESYHQEHSG